MTLLEIHSRLAFLILENRCFSDTKVCLQLVLGGLCNEVVFIAYKPINSTFGMRITFNEAEDGNTEIKDNNEVLLKMQMIEQFLKKEITFDQLFN